MSSRTDLRSVAAPSGRADRFAPGAGLPTDRLTAASDGSPTDHLT
jgi:hypothetical protein